jgi:hypothetical protein
LMASLFQSESTSLMSFLWWRGEHNRKTNTKGTKKCYQCTTSSGCWLRKMKKMSIDFSLFAFMIIHCLLLRFCLQTTYWHTIRIKLTLNTNDFTIRICCCSRPGSAICSIISPNTILQEQTLICSDPTCLDVHVIAPLFTWHHTSMPLGWTCK